MKDPIKKLREIQYNNNKAFQKVDEASRIGRAVAGVANVGKSIGKGVKQAYQQGANKKQGAVVYNGGNQFTINGNVVDYLVLHDSPKDIVSSPDWQGQWAWLLEGKYHCRYLSLKGAEVVFCGDWMGGDCKATHFQDTLSYMSRFLGGRFIGGAYEADNNGFGKEVPSDLPHVSPTAFYSGTYTDNDKGIFGYIDAVENPNGYTEMQLIRIPVGYYLILNKGLKTEVGFKLLKRIDEKNSTFSFATFPTERSVNLAWTTLWANFDRYNFIKVGSPYEIPGIIKINKISSIHIQKAHQYVKKNFVIIPLKKSPELTKMKLGINLTVPVQGKNHREKIAAYESDLYNNEMPQKIRALKAGNIDGYYGYDSLKELFNGYPGKQKVLPNNLKGNLEYLAEFFDYVVNRSPQKQKFIAALRQFLGVPAEPAPSDVQNKPEGQGSSEEELVQKYVEKEKLKKAGKLKQQ